MKNFFSHDEGARNDPKLIKVLMRLGQAGKGVYWDLIEMLYEQDGYLLLSECESYAFALRTECTVIESLINDFGLFVNDGERFWSDSALRRLNLRKDKSQKAAESAQKRWKNANDMPSHSEGNAIKGKEKKVNESKEKEEESVGSDADASTQPPDSSEIEKHTFEEEKKETPPPGSAPPPPQKRVMDKPTLTEVQAHFHLQMSPAWLAEKFFNHYESNGWMAGRVPMKKWQAAANKWIGEEKTSPTRNQSRPHANGTSQTGPSAITGNKPIGGYVFDLDAEIAKRSVGHYDNAVVHDAAFQVVE